MNFYPQVLCFVHKPPSELDLVRNINVCISSEEIEKCYLCLNMSQLLTDTASWAHTKSSQACSIILFQLFIFSQPSFGSKLERLLIVFGIVMSCCRVILNCSAFTNRDAAKKMILYCYSWKIDRQRTIISCCLFYYSFDVL